jgi:OFA family oxalate/formate antiporter-like MFS transporter
MKWFPNNKGLVTGISVAGFGSGAIVLSAVAEHYLSSGMDVLLFFRLWGIVSGSILLIASLVLMEPVAPKKSKIKRAGVKEIKSKQFFICAIGIFAGTFLGLFINGNLIPILSENGIPHHQALKAIPLFAVGNALGRITWGHFFDTLGYKSIPISLIGLSIVSLFLILPLSSWVLFLDIILIGFFFGSNFVIYASSIARYFGQTLFSTLYPMVFLAYGIAGFIAPGIGGYFIDLTGSFHISLFVAISIVLSAGVFSIVRLTVFNNSIPAKHS